MVGHGTNTGLLMGMAVNICWFVLCVCFYLRCIIIPKHFHWLATNLQAFPRVLRAAFRRFCCCFYTATSTSLTLEG